MLKYFENCEIWFSWEEFPSGILEMHSEIYQKLQGPFLPGTIEMSLKCVLEVEWEGLRVGDSTSGQEKSVSFLGPSLPAVQP